LVDNDACQDRAAATDQSAAISCDRLEVARELQQQSASV
jgi:hypothetical protein